MHYQGLTNRQVEENRRLHGANILTELPPESLWRKLLHGFRNPLIEILLVALLLQLGLFFWGRAQWYEPFGVLVAILLANGVAAVFEWRQEGKAVALRRMAQSQESTKVFRNGVLIEVPVEELVVDDEVFLQSGDKIPADGTLLEGELMVDQAALNGESEPVPKRPLNPCEETSNRDLLDPCSLYRGTVICGGEGCLKVQMVGDRTEFGKASLAAQTTTRETPLQVKLGVLARQITRFGYCGAIAIVVAILLATFLRGQAPNEIAGWLRLTVDAVTVAVTIIVCAVPEGLPMLSSLLQALQSLKMVKDQVLVRKIHGLETAGSLNILFCDKTGTITEGRLSVAEVATGDGRCQAELSALPTFLRDDLLAGLGLNNHAVPSQGKVIGGNATDRALMQFLVESGQAEKLSRDQVVSFREFDSVRKSSSAVVRQGDVTQVYVKGAPENLLAYCDGYVDDQGVTQPWNDSTRQRLEEYLAGQASRSMRLLAVAKALGEHEDAPLTLLGVVSIRDQVRTAAKNAIAEIQQAGVQVVMVTGDRLETAVAIAREAGMLASPDAVVFTSRELAQKSDDEVKALLPRLRVVARALPLDKSRLVRLAQELDLVVGMTGDGVNDAPALRRADVGFAMGSGTEVAKAAGEITILDDNLASIEKAILYGRTMFKSIRKFLVFQLTVNVAAVFICAIGPVCGENVVMTVIQLLLVNLAMDTLAAIAYGSEPPSMEYLREPPVPRSEHIVTATMRMQVFLGATVVAAICLGILFVVGIQNLIGVHGSAEIHSALFATFMMAITFNGFTIRSTHLNPLTGIMRNWTFVAVMASILALQFIFVTFGGEALSVTPLSPAVWVKCILLAVIPAVANILRKLF